MKTKYFALGLSAVVAAGGLWFGRAAWRAHQQLVTLEVHNVPFAEVLRKLERQTWRKIRAERTLDTRVTLHVVNKPLSYVLDRLAEQAGAQWCTLYAVYDSTRALNALDTALRGNGKLDAAGWKKLAPSLPPMNIAGPDDLGHLAAPGAAPQVRRLEQKPGAGATVTATEDVIVDGPGNPKPGASASAAGPSERRPITLRVVRRGGAGGPTGVEEEIWTPEELVMESALSGRLGDQHSDAATPAAAATTAQKVKGRWTTYYALRKSGLGMAFGGLPMPRPGAELHRIVLPGAGTPPGGTNADAMAETAGPPPLDLEAAAQRERNDHFARLTPEQRVQRARQRLGLNQN